MKTLIYMEPPTLNLQQLVALGNEAAPTGEPLIGLGNAVAIDDHGWAIIPYGEHMHEQGLQRFGREQAEEIEGYFRNTWNTIKRAIVGLPIYKGHPDLVDQRQKSLANAKDEATRARIRASIEELKRRYPDRANYGSIADLEVRDDGLAVKPVLTGDGATLVNEKGLRYFSPHWLARQGPKENGRDVFTPAFLLSIGLTDNPNIHGTSLVNSRSGSPDQSNPQLDTTMPKWLLELLGFANEAEATQENVTTKVKNLLARPEQTALANEQTRVGTLTTERDTAKTKQTEAEMALANERSAHGLTRKAYIGTLVDNAIRDGRITEAQKPVWAGRLERDFTAESTALANESVKVKITPMTGNMGGRQASSDAAQQFEALVNEALPKHGNNRDRAWATVKTSKPGKALWEQMQAGEAK